MNDASRMEVSQGTGNFCDPEPHSFFRKRFPVDMEPQIPTQPKRQLIIILRCALEVCAGRGHTLDR